MWNMEQCPVKLASSQKEPISILPRWTDLNSSTNRKNRENTLPRSLIVAVHSALIHRTPNYVRSIVVGRLSAPRRTQPPMYGCMQNSSNFRPHGKIANTNFEGQNLAWHGRVTVCGAGAKPPNGVALSHVGGLFLPFLEAQCVCVGCVCVCVRFL